MVGDNEHCDAMTLHNDGPVIFVFLKSSASVGTIAHESWHAVRHMLGTLGVDLDSETVAYHLGYLVDKIFRFMRGKRG